MFQFPVEILPLIVFLIFRFPFPVDMRKKDLAGELSTARDSTYLHLGLGSCV